jgi:hypothetical protein
VKREEAAAKGPQLVARDLLKNMDKKFTTLLEKL